MSYLLVFIGGGVGCVARYAVSQSTSIFYKGSLPWATFISNILACVLLALIVVFFSEKLSIYPWLSPLVLIGFCGGFSTFSTFSNQTAELFLNGQIAIALANILLSVVVGVGLIVYMKSKV